MSIDISKVLDDRIENRIDWDRLYKVMSDNGLGLVFDKVRDGKVVERGVFRDKSNKEGVNSQVAELKRDLNLGKLTSEEYAQHMTSLFKGEDGYVRILEDLLNDPNISQSSYEKIIKESSEEQVV